MDSTDDSDDVMTVAVADYQSAGRGQGGNHWESEEGKNLLMSIMTHPRQIEASGQFLLSMALACALRDVLGSHTDGISIKWPNDIYWHDKKISGTLIETRLKGKEIRDCVFGIGINVNQEVFHSDAPNPVSLHNILGKHTPVEEVMNAVIERLTHYLYNIKAFEASEKAADAIRDYYLRNLYRRDGRLYPFEDAGGQFMASIDTVLPDGTLKLVDSEGKERLYSFKEVKFII